VREGLKRIINECADIELVGEAVNGDEALTRCSKENIDVLLLDISMPGLEFFEIIRRLGLKKPELRILVLSIHSEDHYAVRALRAGAAGYLTKDRSSEELAKAIRHVYKGKNYVTASLAEKLVSELDISLEKKPHEMLSNREYQIFLLLSSGKRITDIATDVALSPKTISTYRTRIFQKMKFNNIAELIRYAVENDLKD
jgi:DNA-binding NarL/FixJ family response regulator